MFSTRVPWSRALHAIAFALTVVVLEAELGHDNAFLQLGLEQYGPSSDRRGATTGVQVNLAAIR